MIVVKKVCAWLLILTGAFIAVLSASAADTTYNLIDLETLGGPSSEAYALNLKGEVVGQADDVVENPQAFLWRNGSIKNLGSVLRGAAYGINFSDQIVGRSGRNAAIYNGNGQVSVLVNSGMFANWEAETLLNSCAYGINDSGQIIGDFGIANDVVEFNYDGGFVFEENANIIPSFVSDISQDFRNEYVFNSGSAINYSGHAVGQNNNHTPVLYSVGASSITSTQLSSSEGLALGINNLDQIVGGTGYSGDLGAIMWENLRPSPLGSLGVYLSQANGINDVGQIVGTSTTALSAQHGFVTDSRNHLLDLNQLLSPTLGLSFGTSSSGWTVSAANAINNAGEIVGTAINPSGNSHAVLMTPAKTVLFEVGVRSRGHYKDPYTGYFPAVLALDGIGNAMNISNAFRANFRSFDGARSKIVQFDVPVDVHPPNNFSLLKSTFDSFASSLTSDDTLIFYFSGHGAVVGGQP